MWLYENTLQVMLRILFRSSLVYLMLFGVLSAGGSIYAADSLPLVKPSASTKDSSVKPLLEDYTDRLQLLPGITITFPIYDGIDSHRRAVGDYRFTIKIDDAGEDGFSFHWIMSPPADATGLRAVSPEDVKDGRQVSLFYQKDQKCTMEGFTNTVRISDGLYRDLKAGRESNFQIDLEDENVPQKIHAVGQEYVEIYVNDRKVRVRTIKAETDNGWNYWILDNADFPVMVQGNGPFRWSEPRFIVADIESRNVIKQLETSGTASTTLILFAFNSARLENTCKPILDGLANYLNQKADVKLAVEAHCDNVGLSEYNLKLSQKRADAVKNYLVGKGVDAARLQANGYGFTQPVADNRTGEGRASNRRVVFKIRP